VIARKEVRRASDAFEFPESFDTRLPLAGGSLAPQQLIVRLGPAIEWKIVRPPGTFPGGLVLCPEATLLVMRGISELRRGRSLQSRAKRLRLRRRQPRYAGKTLRSAFKAPPRTPRPSQPYLGTDVNVADLIG
jgi:hypothetical protein